MREELGYQEGYYDCAEFSQCLGVWWCEGDLVEKGGMDGDGEKEGMKDV